MKIEISNRQNNLPLNSTKLKHFSQWLMERIDPVDASRTWAQLTLILTDHAGMIPVQEACFGKRETTDVVSQVYDPIPPHTAGHSGELVVNVEQAQDCAATPGLPRELAWYIAHGCHHLAGAVDDTPAQRADMHRREQTWLDEAEALGLLAGLIDSPDHPS
jgi:rRNA maturation RNase YbeY